MAKTSVQVNESTRDKLREIGKKGESYDVIILRLMAKYEEVLEKKRLVTIGGIRN